MKRNFINKLLASSALVLAGGLVSCNDYLTLYPTDSITKEEFWGSKNDVENVRNAAYYQLTQNTSKILTWGEFRSDNVELNKTDKTEYRYLQDGVLLPDKGMFDWSSMYKGINLCNEVLDNGERMVRDKVDPSFNEGDFAPIKSEMIALRALYYFYLVRAYRDVPFVEHSVDAKHLKKLGLSALNIHFSANNLFRWTKYSGVEPEHGAAGYSPAIDSQQTPNARSFTFSLNFGF